MSQELILLFTLFLLTLTSFNELFGGVGRDPVGLVEFVRRYVLYQTRLKIFCCHALNKK